jgi:hypothetical protein
MKRRSFTNAGGLASSLTGLPNLDRASLVTQWQILYGSAPPAGISRSLLIRAIAYRLQEQTLGGLKPSLRRFLEKAPENNASRRQISMPAAGIKPGTRLLREWHGVTYEVIMLEGGVQCNGKRYRSLSEVARAITGARWSGPLFFGLKKAAA